MLRVALVGIGDAAKHHARALSALALEGALSWTAICARDTDRNATFRSELGIATAVVTYPSLDALLDARACDAVILATPDGIHAVQIERAASAGVGVLVEKPLASSLADGERAIAAARAANVHLAVGYHLRHHPAHRLAASRLRELVGEVRTIFVRWAWPDPAVDGWRARGEGATFWSLAALGTHGIDLAMWLSGSKADAGQDMAALASSVASVTEPALGTDRAAEVSFRWGSTLVHVSVSVVHRAVSRLIISGDAGELEAIGTLGARGDGELWHRAPRGAATNIAFEPANPYAAQLREFVSRAARGFGEDPALLANLTVLDRIEKARSPRRRQGSS
jgi:predicted dehydrogenase